MTEREKMLAGELYFAGDPELVALRQNAKNLFRKFERETDPAILRELLGSCGEEVTIEDGFRCDYGFNIHVGERFFANYNSVILDCAEVRIGDDCFFAPGVSLYTATHPVETRPRIDQWEYAKPITIGDKCWLGGNAIVLPGVTIGDEVVVGAGAVVTKDVPNKVVVAGNPARILRTIED